MSPEQLQQHLLLKTRARTIPDKKKQNDRRACRNSRQALRGLRGVSARDREREGGVRRVRLFAADDDGQRVDALPVLDRRLAPGGDRAPHRDGRPVLGVESGDRAAQFHGHRMDRGQ